MNKGEIILITFPFTDLSGSKLRPALVLASDRDDVTVAFITTNLQQGNNTDMFLQKSSTNGLKKDSLLKMKKVILFSCPLPMDLRRCFRIARGTRRRTAQAGGISILFSFSS
jgi:hypothetical protein